MASKNSTNKRKRAAAGTLHISDLPIGLVVEDVSAYLSKPSKVVPQLMHSSNYLIY